MKKLLSVFLVLALCLYPFSVYASSYGLTIQYLNVGEADAALIECDGEYMMIDCGSDKIDKDTRDFKELTIEKYLEEQNVNKLSYVICTHPDTDHFYGFIKLLDNIKFDTVYCSKYKNDTVNYTQFKKKANRIFKWIKTPKEGEQFKLGSANVEILASNVDISNSNDSSIVIKITYGDTNFLFTGDAQNQTENYLQNNKKKKIRCNVLKVAHHGKKTSSNEDFLSDVHPDYLIVSCDRKALDNNDINPEIIEYCKKQSRKLNKDPNEEIENKYIDNHLFYTCNGTIICKSNGKKIEFFDRNGKRLNQ